MDKKSIFRTFRLYLVITIGSIIAALGYALFQVPHGIAAGGVSGIAILVNRFTGWQVGAMVWLMNVPILVLTTESSDDLKTRARDAGATGWIVKPFDDASLVSVLRRLTGNAA